MSARRFSEWLDAVRRLLAGKGGRVLARHPALDTRFTWVRVATAVHGDGPVDTSIAEGPLRPSGRIFGDD